MSNKPKKEKDYPSIKIKNPPKPWSPCSGSDCEHSSHEKCKHGKNINGYCLPCGRIHSNE